MSEDRTIRVVIAEDSPYDAELAVYALKRHGYAVEAIVATSESELREALSAAVPDLVISDYSMLQMDGKMALAIARELAPSVPFVFLSGSVFYRQADGESMVGATAVLDKQDMFRLGEIVAKALEGR